MKEVKSKKTGKISILSDADYRVLVDLKIDNRYEVTELKPLRAIISPDKTIKKKNETRRTEDSE